jgi:hypothetical protein
MFRIIAVVVVLAALIIGAAFPNLIPPQVRNLFREDDSSPKAAACRAEAIAKFPTDMQEIGRTPDGTGKMMINRNAGPYAEAYAACMKR